MTGAMTTGPAHRAPAPTPAAAAGLTPAARAVLAQLRRLGTEQTKRKHASNVIVSMARVRDRLAQAAGLTASEAHTGFAEVLATGVIRLDDERGPSAQARRYRQTTDRASTTPTTPTRDRTRPRSSTYTASASATPTTTSTTASPSGSRCCASSAPNAEPLASPGEPLADPAAARPAAKH